MRRVNGLEEARAALKDGARELLSPPYAACHAGVGYYTALIGMLKEEFPDNDFTFTVCCGDDPAIAHDALRLGIPAIVCEASPEMQEKLTQIAEAQGARLWSRYPAA